ncbi:MAG: hypothetical protein ACLFVW_02230 [Phycisphaerae bacterium]
MNAQSRFVMPVALAAVLMGLVLASACAANNPAGPNVPTDNPVATFYDGQAGYPAWTDRIAWGRVIDMSRYANGDTEFERFENARDELHATGGGVLYYPAGTYDFSDRPATGPDGAGLMLRSGVIIRGEKPPAGRDSAVGGDGLKPPTRFILGFQQRAGGQVPLDWNIIGLKPSKGERLADVDNVGVCWVHLEGGTVYFGPDFDWGEDATWSNAGSWRSAFVKTDWADRVPDGTHPGDPFMAGPVHIGSNHGRDPDGTPFEGAPGIEPVSDVDRFRGAGDGRLVIGCVFEDSAVLNDYDTAGRKEAPEGFGPDGFHMARYAARIATYGSRVFIANNHLPIGGERHFAYEQTTVRTRPGRGNDYHIESTRTSRVLFDYGRVMGIDVNKDLLALLQAPLRDDYTRGYHSPGVAVIDNRVANHGHKGFNLSGRWMVVRGNLNEREILRGGGDPYDIGGWRLTLDGFVESSPGGGGMISDNYSRAFDMAGRDLWLDANYYENLGSDPGNDGEGILCQNHNGTHIRSWAVTRTMHKRGEGKASYIGGWAVGVQGMLLAWNSTPGTVGMPARPIEPADIAIVANDAGGLAAPQGAVTRDPPGELHPPRIVRAEIVDGDAVRIRWADATDTEIGYRIDRRIGDGPWSTIAYRPPQIQGHELNQPEWRDYLAPTGCELRYRVAAIKSDDGDQGLSQPTNPVTLQAR